MKRFLQLLSANDDDALRLLGLSRIPRCAECDVELVPVLPEEEGEPGVELVEVWEAYGEVNAQLVRSLLESFGVQSVLKGEAIRYIHGFTLNGLGRVRILVRADEEEQARDILSGIKGDVECPHCTNLVEPQEGKCPLCGGDIEQVR